MLFCSLKKGLNQQIWVLCFAIIHSYYKRILWAISSIWYHSMPLSVTTLFITKATIALSNVCWVSHFTITTSNCSSQVKLQQQLITEDTVLNMRRSRLIPRLLGLLRLHAYLVHWDQKPLTFPDTGTSRQISFRVFIFTFKPWGISSDTL